MWYTHSIIFGNELPRASARGEQDVYSAEIEHIAFCYRLKP